MQRELGYDHDMGVAAPDCSSSVIVVSLRKIQLRSKPRTPGDGVVQEIQKH